MAGTHTLLLGCESGLLLLAHPASGSVRQAAALEGLLPAGECYCVVLCYCGECYCWQTG